MQITLAVSPFFNVISSSIDFQSMNTPMEVGKKRFKEWLFLEDAVVARKERYAGYFKCL